MTTVEARAYRPLILDPAALAQLAHADPLRPADTPHLLAYLATSTTPGGPAAAATQWWRSLPWPPPRS